MLRYLLAYYVVGKQPSIPLINLGKMNAKLMMMMMMKSNVKFMTFKVRIMSTDQARSPIFHSLVLNIYWNEFHAILECY